jgi:hypothetical protein
MELDQQALQWLFDVVMITGSTCLAALCCALKEENKKLALELAQVQLRDEDAEITVMRSAVPSSISEEKIGAMASPLEHQDIRHFVALRSQYWLPLTR